MIQILLKYILSQIFKLQNFPIVYKLMSYSVHCSVHYL